MRTCWRRCVVALVVSLLSMIGSRSAFAQKCLAPDFKVDLLYSVPEIEHPSVVTCDDDGNLFVGEDPMDMRGPTSKEFDRVLFIQFGPDGKPVKKTVFCDKLAAVFGLIWHDGALYVMHAPHYSVFRDTDGDGVADERKDLATGFGPPAGVYGFNDHIVTGTRLGLDGRVYVSVGDKGVPKAVGSDGSAITLEGGGVIRMKLDGSELEIVSSGTRNHLDVAMDSLDNIFSYDNTDDGLGWWSRFTHHVPTGYYGYPYDYHPHPERHLPRITEHGGGSPVGAACYREAAWPATYVDSPFFCEWGKQKVQRFKLKKKGASFEAELEDFFVPDGSGEPFRPLDLTFSPDGKHMYLADWNYNGWVNPAVKGRLYRITYTGSEPAVKDEPARAPKNATVDQLVASLGHPSHAERLRVQFALAKLAPADVQKKVADVVSSKDTPAAARVHALWTLEALTAAAPNLEERRQRQAAANSAWDAGLSDADASVRAQAARVISLERGENAKLTDLLLKDADATVRMQAAIALGRHGDPLPAAKWKSTDAGQAGAIVSRESDTQLTELKSGCSSCAADLEKALGDGDDYVRHVVVQALRVVNNWSEIGSTLKSENPRARSGAILALTGVYDEEAVQALREVALTGTATPDRIRAIEALAEVHRRAAPYVKGWWGTQPARGKPARDKNQEWSGTSTVAAGLRAVMEGNGPHETKLAVIKAWRTVNDPAALPMLRNMAHSHYKSDGPIEAVITLAALKDKESVPLFAKIASDEKCWEELRREAVKGITAIGSPEAVKQLVDLISADKTSPELVGLTLEALGKIKNADSASVVEKRLTDSNAAVRIKAAEAFGAIRGADGAAQIAELLKDSDVGVKKAALAVLAKNSGEAPKPGRRNKGENNDQQARRAAYVPAVIAAANDPAVKFEAQMALAQIIDRRALALYLDGLTSPNQDLRNASLNALVTLRSSISDDILKLHELNELPAKARGPLQQVFSAPAPVLKWQVLGSFPKEPKDKLPELDRAAAPDLTQLHHVGERALKWKAVELTDKDGRLDPGKHVDGSRDGVWVFAYTAIETEAAGPRSFVVGSDDQLIVHVNGKQVYEFMANRGWDKAQGQFSAELQAGTNHIWIQCGNDGGPWDCSLAISSRDPKFAFLFENATPMLDISAFRDFALKNAGEASNGQKIFENPKGVGCVKCHAVSGVGGKVGPDLVGIGARYPKDELIRSILEPSARIANGFDTGIIETKDGRVITGVLKLESPEAVELMTNEGKTIRIPADEIEDKARSPVSTMPNGIKDGLTLQDFADIVAYLESLKQAAK